MSTSRASTVVFQDDFSGADGPTLGGAWQEGNEVSVRTCCAGNGFHVDGGMIERFQQALAFHYVASPERAANAFTTAFPRPYAYAALASGSIAAPLTMSFSFEPSTDERLDHRIGLMNSSGGFSFDPSPSELTNVASPNDGIMVTIGRSSWFYPNSALYLTQFRAGVASSLGSKSLPFQYTYGTRYTVSLSLSSSGAATVTVTDGGTNSSTLQGMATLPLPALDQVVIADEQGGVSFDTSQPDDYRVLFDDVAVTTIAPAARLQFPLKNQNGSFGNPYAWNISAVFDHSMGKGLTFCPDNVVTAFSGESGTTNGSASAPPPARFSVSTDAVRKNGPCPGQTLQGWQQPLGVPFILTGAGRYTGGCPVGSGCDRYLYYDGHPGIDFQAVYVPVFAAAAGTVTYVDSPKFGRLEISHAGAVTTLYAHLSRIDVALGQPVAKGTQIGISGNKGTGCPASSPCPHLHFGAIRNGVPVDPFGWFPLGKTGAIYDPYYVKSGAINERLWQ